MNRLHMISMAVVAVCTTQVHALTPLQIDTARNNNTLKEVRIAGASALRLSVAAYLKEICTASSFDVIWNSNSEGTFHRAYSCNLAVAQGNYLAGTPILVYKRDEGGSGQGVNPIARADDQRHMKVLNDATCTAINGGTPATDAAVPSYICTGTETTGIKSDAGISDVEPLLFSATVNLPTGGTGALTPAQLGTLDVAPLAQALFAVAVNTKAYRALQEAQGIIAPGAALLDVPADQATWTDATLDTIPSVPSNWVRSVLTGQGVGGNAARGWNVVIPNVPYKVTDTGLLRPAVDTTSARKALNICRRVEGSGTQAISNVFFANNPCGAGSASYSPLGNSGSAGDTGTLVSFVESREVSPGVFTPVGLPWVQEGSGSGNVEGCLGADTNSAVQTGTDNTAYAIGWLGREANPKRGGNDLGYRYVRLDGVAPVRNEAKAGRYAAVYEATMQWNRNTLAGQTDKITFLAALRNGFGSPNGLAAVDSDTQQGVMSPPAAWSGTYDAATGNTALFGSRVGRVNGNSCAPLRVVR